MALEQTNFSATNIRTYRYSFNSVPQNLILAASGMNLELRRHGKHGLVLLQVRFCKVRTLRISAICSVRGEGQFTARSEIAHRGVEKYHTARTGIFLTLGAASRTSGAL